MQIDAASFRDPNGFIFRNGANLFRQINQSYAADYELLMTSGLYESLVKEGALIAHREAALSTAYSADAYKVIQPERIPFISYPYGWSFAQLREAALATLRIQEKALAFGMSLKDASAYNVQFKNSQAVFIDTLSFEKYEDGKPWAAYRQFCQHFLAPLTLMAKVDIRLGKLCESFIDGIPLDLAASLLPRRTKFNLNTLMHIHLHSKAQAKYSESTSNITKKRTLSKNGLLGVLASLRSAVKGLKWGHQKTEWADYYEHTNYSDSGKLAKQNQVEAFLSQVPSPDRILDLGANTGQFSLLAKKFAKTVISSDIDYGAVQRNFVRAAANKDDQLFPVMLDLANPSPALGWACEERSNFFQRAKPDVTLCLALIHHLVISNNVPLGRLVNFFAELSPYLIIEFVPKSDSQVKILLANRPDIFENYDESTFETLFSAAFKKLGQVRLEGTERSLYLFKRL